EAAGAGDGEGDYDTRTGIGRGRVAGDHEDARANDGADAQCDQVDGTQGALEILVMNFRDWVFCNNGHGHVPPSTCLWPARAGGFWVTLARDGETANRVRP